MCAKDPFDGVIAAAAEEPPGLITVLRVQDLHIITGPEADSNRSARCTDPHEFAHNLMDPPVRNVQEGAHGPHSGEHAVRN